MDSPGQLVLETLKHVLRLTGLSLNEAKYFLVLLKYKICRLVELDLGAVETLSTSDVMIMNVAIKQVAKAASELVQVWTSIYISINNDINSLCYYCSSSSYGYMEEGMVDGCKGATYTRTCIWFYMVFNVAPRMLVSMFYVNVYTCINI